MAPKKRPEDILWGFINDVKNDLKDLTAKEKADLSFRAAKVLIDMDKKQGESVDKYKEQDLSHIKNEELFKILGITSPAKKWKDGDSVLSLDGKAVKSKK